MALASAEKLYRKERAKLDAEQLSAQPNGTSLPRPAQLNPVLKQGCLRRPDPPAEASSEHQASKPISDEATPASKSDPTTPAPPRGDTTSDGGSENGGGGDFFGTLLDEVPQSELNDTGTAVPVLAMARLLHYSGKTRKVALEEDVQRQNKYMTVVFKALLRSRGFTRRV